MVRRTRLDRGFEATQTTDIVVEAIDRGRREFTDRYAARGGRGIDLVVDVRDVADIRDIGLSEMMAQDPEQDIEDDEWPGVAEMDQAIDRRTADIESHPSRLDGDKLLLAARKRVVDGQRHGSVSEARTRTPPHQKGLRPDFHRRDRHPVALYIPHPSGKAMSLSRPTLPSVPIQGCGTTC